MKKIETIWHYLLYQAIEQKEFQHTQAGLAELFHFSTSTINLALVKPTAIGAVRKSGKFFVLADVFKLLYLAATIRSLAKDILYQTHSSKGLLLPPLSSDVIAPPKRFWTSPPPTILHFISTQILKIYPKSNLATQHPT